MFALSFWEFFGYVCRLESSDFKVRVIEVRAGFFRVCVWGFRFRLPWIWLGDCLFFLFETLLFLSMTVSRVLLNFLDVCRLTPRFA